MLRKFATNNKSNFGTIKNKGKEDFQKNSEEMEDMSGMDMVLCIIDPQSKQLQYR